MSALSCPQCGGELAVASGERLVRCGFCDGTLYVDRSGLVSHYSLPWLLDQPGALAALRRFMAGNHTVKDLDTKASFGAVERLTFPVWLFRLETARGEAVVVEPAAPTPIPQVADLEVPAGKLERFHAALPGVTATPASVPLDTARGWAGERVAGSRLIENALVEVPFWRFHYAYGGTEYAALVDGSTGAVLAAVYPQKRESPFVGVAGCGLLAFLAGGFLVVNPVLKLLLYLALAVPLVGLAWWIARKV